MRALGHTLRAILYGRVRANMQIENVFLLFTLSLQTCVIDRSTYIRLVQVLICDVI